MTEARDRYHVPAAFAAHANLRHRDYVREYQASVEAPEAFWGRIAERIDWMRAPTRIKDVSFHEADFRIRWYADGELNVSDQAQLASMADKREAMELERQSLVQSANATLDGFGQLADLFVRQGRLGKRFAQGRGNHGRQALPRLFGLDGRGLDRGLARRRGLRHIRLRGCGERCCGRSGRSGGFDGESRGNSGLGSRVGEAQLGGECPERSRDGDRRDGEGGKKSLEARIHGCCLSGRRGAVGWNGCPGACCLYSRSRHARSSGPWTPCPGLCYVELDIIDKGATFP